ncbi:UDP-glucuronic acid decarboxylase family protein [Pseudoroseicyclus aestuarii]|uniref:UDP-glucuronate decarboxylase n=1 Tax=Pseudoroseicyclus aestuarii TaxID=1795041 RepID=A0A318SP76_9RHOB|nr:UDP-glucuronic acid decarboxylase family protein [Pseudoroseicyclus aestuarii]PYE83681.1 UDP-glucuronate decarboxylase [Pseudoroseicyclus aestuarii]
MTPTLPLRTVLVAGGAGFIGSHLCEALLAGGARVICLDSFLTGRRETVQPLLNNRGFSVVQAEVTEPLPDLGRLDEIYNLASPASPPRYQADPVHTMMTNVIGTRNLLALARAQGARYLQASTSEVYGDPEQHPQPEDYWGHVNCTGPRACYDEGKRAAEALCWDHARMGTDVRVARIFNTYGPQMDPEDGRIVSNLIVQALTGRPLTIYGSGTQTRSFCYVTDMVAGLMALMAVDPRPEGPVNLGNPFEFTILELAEQVQALIPGALPHQTLPLPQDDPKMRRPDIARAQALLGWSPEVPLAQGLKATADWFARHLGIEPAEAAKGRI